MSKQKADHEHFTTVEGLITHSEEECNKHNDEVARNALKGIDVFTMNVAEDPFDDFPLPSGPFSGIDFEDAWAEAKFETRPRPFIVRLYKGIRDAFRPN